MRVALYARVSTSKQDTDNQVRQLKNYAARMEWDVTHVLEETEHGWEPDRAKLKELFALASRREIDMVLVWSMDRFSRQGIRTTLQLLHRLSEDKVTFWSYKEEFLRSLDPRLAEFVISAMAFAHEQEYLIRKERVKAGLERVKQEGVRLGRPATLTIDLQPEVKRLRDEMGLSWREVGLRLKMPPTSVRKLYSLA